MAPEADLGATSADITRRLSDKILTAFNHAYAVGEVEIARHLRKILERNERDKNGAKSGRQNDDPVQRADMWVAFVESRNQFRKISDKKGVKEQDIEAALLKMKEAYRQWSDG